MYAEEIAFASQEPTNSRSDVVLVGLSWWGRGRREIRTILTVSFRLLEESTRTSKNPDTPADCETDSQSKEGNRSALRRL